MEQLAKYHKRHPTVGKISAIILSMLCAGLISCSSSDQENTSSLPYDQPRDTEVHIKNSVKSVPNPFSKVAATVESDTQSASPDRVVKTKLTGVAHQTEIYLANVNQSDTSSTSWNCETINTDNEENNVSLKFNSDNSGTVNNLMMRWSVTTENIIVITIPDTGIVRLSGIEFEIEGEDAVQFTTIDDKAEHSKCTRS